MLFVCGDFNIDLFNTFENNPTAESINKMYNASLYPSITRPTRITTHGATLIDNIYATIRQFLQLFKAAPGPRKTVKLPY